MRDAIGDDHAFTEMTTQFHRAVIERSVIGPYASIGAHAVVRDSVVRDSIVEDGAVIHDAVLEHSVIGRGAKVDGRAMTLNVGDTSQTVL